MLINPALTYILRHRLFWSYVESGVDPITGERDRVL